jgi:DNA polymerase III subunit epsilon
MYSVVDIETTGGSPQQSRITEIAVYVTDGEKLVDQFISLVNPEQKIPPFITRLTGISDEMVTLAPKFPDISSQIARLTKDTVFVAHNAAFDYGMLRHEYREMGMEFHRRVLCTVKSGRRLLPGYKSYSLGNLCKELGIELMQRHRASGDAFATLELFKMLHTKHQEELLLMIEDGYPRFTGDPRHDEMLRNIPESTGVYFLHDTNKDIIYIGSGTNIRKKVLHHLTKTVTRTAFELRNSIADVTFEITGSELLSQLMEASEIKRSKPIFNRRFRIPPQHSNTQQGSLLYLIDKGPDRFTKTVIRVTSEHIGWGYFPAEQQFTRLDELDLYIKYAALGVEFRMLVNAFLEKGRVEKIIDPFKG